MAAKLQIDLGMVQTLYMAGVRPVEIARQTGCKAATIGAWATRYGWVKALRGMTQSVQLMQNRSITQDNRLREALRTEASEMVAKLRETPIKSAADLANTPLRQGRAAVLKTLVESVSMIEDWDAQKRSGLVLCDLLTGEPGSTTEIAAQVESVPCVSDATTGSVPPTDLNALTPTSAQDVESTPLAGATTNDNGSCAKSDAPAP